MRNASETQGVAAWPEADGALLGYENRAPGRSATFFVPAGRLVLRLRPHGSRRPPGAREARELTIDEGQALEVVWP